MFRVHVATAIIIAMFAFVDSANATNSRAKAKQANGRYATTRSEPSTCLAIQ